MNIDYNDAEAINKHLIHTYNRKIVFESGEGMYLTDVNGKKYLDMGAGIAVNALGYADKDFISDVTSQLNKLIHISNLYFSPSLIDASYLVAEATGLDKVFFTNSGTEAIEGALKMARKYKWLQNKESKGEIIAMEHSFHGRSMGALSVTGKEAYRTAFEPLIGGVKFAEYNNLDSVKALITPDTCAIILETLQGEGGIYPADDEFIKGIRKLCDENDIVMILDEIQCGMGRTGKMFTYEHYGIKPDIVTMAKAIGCGLPIGAFAASSKLMDALVPGDHGTTYGGNPLATAGVCSVFKNFKNKNILANVQKEGAYLRARLDELKDKYDCIIDVRGKGLMLGIEFNVAAGPIIEKLTDAGVLVIAAGTSIIRVVPPLIVEDKHIDSFIEALEGALA
ncbi:MAG: aspartate aminotransferase family protein [Lachnospiraceae bacterium]|nr:aspartate aminotransferase family protein [Lachnospiraceae bacterium]